MTVELTALSLSEFQQATAELNAQQCQVLTILFGRKGRHMSKGQLKMAAKELDLRYKKARALRDAALAAVHKKAPSLHIRLIAKGMKCR